MPDAPIVKRLIRDKKAEFFHSSAYGRAQSGGTIGAASTESFAKRREIDKNRQNIRKYDDSLVAEQRFNPEGAGVSRIDQPQTDTDKKPTFYEEMLNAAKENSGIDSTKSTTNQGQQNVWNKNQDPAATKAEKLARQLAGQGKITQKEMEKRIAQAQQEAEGQNVGNARGNGINRGGQGANMTDLNSLAAQRAQRSARFADKSRQPLGGPAGGRPQSVRPMRQFQRPPTGA